MAHRIRHVAFVLVFLCIAAVASAQTPGAPTSLTATLNADNTVTLSWFPPTTGGVPSGYLVQIGTTSGGSETLSQQIGNVTTFRTPVLASGTYYFRVRALNSSGIGPPSNEVTITAPCITPSTAPRFLATRRQTTTTVTITWVPPTTSGYTGWKIDIGDAPGLGNVTNATVSGANVTFATVNVPADVSLFVRVRATNECGDGPQSEDAFIENAVAGTSNNVLVNEIGAQSTNKFVELKNVSANPVDVSGWRVFTSTGPNQIVQLAATLPAGMVIGKGCTLLLAPTSTVFNVSVDLVSSELGDGIALTRADGTFIDTVGQRTSNTTSDATTPFGDAILLENRIESANLGIRSFARINDFDTNNNFNDFAALTTPNPQNAANCTGNTPPSAPQNLTVTVNGNTVTLTWTAPSVGGVPTGYTLEAGSAPGTSNIGVFALPAVTAATFAGVPNGTYYVRVRAITSLGTSAPSNEVIIVVCTSGCTTPPGPVTNLTAQVSGSQVLLAWTRPATGGTPTGYVVEAGTASGLANLGQIPTGSTAEFVIVTNVPRGTYFVRVRASAGGVLGPASNEVIVVVP